MSQVWLLDTIDRWSKFGRPSIDQWITKHGMKMKKYKHRFIVIASTGISNCSLSNSSKHFINWSYQSHIAILVKCLQMPIALLEPPPHAIFSNMWTLPLKFPAPTRKRERGGRRERGGVGGPYHRKCWNIQVKTEHAIVSLIGKEKGMQQEIWQCKRIRNALNLTQNI